jgi:hypothetical protein
MLFEVLDDDDIKSDFLGKTTVQLTNIIMNPGSWINQVISKC